ncbi:MAG: hypothetical protein AAF429_06395 [Pseudomonadota bacterium]
MAINSREWALMGAKSAVKAALKGHKFSWLSRKSKIAENLLQQVFERNNRPKVPPKEFYRKLLNARNGRNKILDAHARRMVKRLFAEDYGYIPQ